MAAMSVYTKQSKKTPHTPTLPQQPVDLCHRELAGHASQIPSTGLLLLMRLLRCAFRLGVLGLRKKTFAGRPGKPAVLNLQAVRLVASGERTGVHPEAGQGAGRIVRVLAHVAVHKHGAVSRQFPRPLPQLPQRDVHGLWGVAFAVLRRRPHVHQKRPRGGTQVLLPGDDGAHPPQCVRRDHPCDLDRVLGRPVLRGVAQLQLLQVIHRAPRLKDGAGDVHTLLHPRRARGLHPQHPARVRSEQKLHVHPRRPRVVRGMVKGVSVHLAVRQTHALEGFLTGPRARDRQPEQPAHGGALGPAVGRGHPKAVVRRDS
eukprot:RCo043511